MNLEDIPKIAITLLLRLFELTRMNFGIRNAGNTFQQLMDHVLSGPAFAFPFLENIFICSKDEVKHQLHLMVVLPQLQGAV